MKRKLLFILAILAVTCWATVAAADQTFTFSDGADRAASAVFSLSGTTLTVTLTNTFAGGVADPVHVLTALFWTSASDNLGSGSAVAPAGSTVWQNGATINATFPLVVGGEWAYGDGVSLFGFTNLQGVSSIGGSIFGSPTFPGANLDGPAAIDGLQYGLLSAGYSGGGNTGVTNDQLVKNSTVFTLTGFTGSLDIGHVIFVYGTDFTEFHSQVPIPPSALLLGSGLLGLVGFGWRRKKEQA